MFKALYDRFFKNDIVTMALRLLLLYVLYFVVRVLFYIVNYQTIGVVSIAELPDLFRGSLLFDTASIVYVNALFILASALPIRVREKSWYQRMLSVLYVGLNGLALIVPMADVVYFKYVQKRFTAVEIFFSDNENTSEVLLEFMSENWYLILVWLLLVAALVWWWRKIKYHPTPIIPNIAYYPITTLWFLISALLCFGGIRGGLSHAVRPITLSNASLYASSIVKSNLVLSNPFCVIRTLGYKSSEVIKYFEAEELDSIYRPIVEPSSGKYFSSQSGKNVVVFVLESFSAEHSALLNSDLYPDGVGYTPFLDSLMREGYYFTYGFANGRKSIDALPSILTSIPSYQTPFMLMPNSMGEKEGMPKLLVDRGYKSFFFNGSERGSMGFGAYASQAGVEEYYSREDFEKERGGGFYDGIWGIWDEPFIDYMGEVLTSTPEPFFASIFTLSSHHPFRVPTEYEYLPKGTTKIHQGVQYTDIALRNFFDKYGSQEWFKNTLFVFTADHVASETYAPKTQTPTGNSHIIYFYYTADGSLKGSTDRVGQQVDIMPTVLNLVGVDRPYAAYGSDAFNRSDSTIDMVINYAGSVGYQAITDSVVMFFDGHDVMAVYDRSDTLQTKNIKDSSPHTEPVLEVLKARVQQYLEHVERRDYIIKE